MSVERAPRFLGEVVPCMIFLGGRSPLAALVFWVGLCVLVGVISGLLTRREISGWYAGLRKPSFNPPNWIFGPVWTTLYILMGVAAWMIWMPAGIATANLCAGVVSDPTRAEFSLEPDLFSLACDCGRAGRGQLSVAGDSGDHGAVLGTASAGRLADGALSGVGQFRDRVEPGNSPAESESIGISIPPFAKSA